MAKRLDPELKLLRKLERAARAHWKRVGEPMPYNKCNCALCRLGAVLKELDELKGK